LCLCACLLQTGFKKNAKPKAKKHLNYLCPFVPACCRQGSKMPNQKQHPNSAQSI
jgi:hypothetical protein